MYISIYQDVDAVNPAKIGAEVSVNSTVDGNYQTRMVSNGPFKVNQKRAFSGLKWIFFSGFQDQVGLEPEFWKAYQ